MSNPLQVQSDVHVIPIVIKTTKQFPVLLVTGARQIGKTTFLIRLSDDKRKFVSLDDPLL